MSLWDIKDFIKYAEEAMAVEGELAEVGVYMGGTALLECEMKGNKPLHLFESFNGFNKINPIDAVSFGLNGLPSDLKFVQATVKGYPEVYIYPGWFPDTSEPVFNKRFCFVHLDANLYQSTKDGLEFFYPRMNKDGIILIHDYRQVVGVNMATEEFAEKAKIKVEQLHNLYGLIRKV